MILAALISFAILLIAWILAPAHEKRRRLMAADEPTTTTSREVVGEVA
ncbi:MAG: hypothetical protein M3P14_06015 [Chloroflexota bacterium]|nr:hypothetical protein [Chloroflexota bacterium]